MDKLSATTKDDITMGSDSEATNDTDNKKKQLQEEFMKFLKTHTVYETIPENMKILVFNVELSIKDAIEAMIKEDIYCGLIWDTEMNKFIGIFTIRDFLNLIKVIYEKIDNYLKNHGKLTNIHNLASSLFPSNKIDLEKLDAILEDPESSKYNSDSKSEKSDMDMALDDENGNTVENNLKNYKEFFKIFKHINVNDYFRDIHHDCLSFHKLISISLDGNLKECIDLMGKNRIHRVIVEDTKSSTFTGFITYETIFEYFIGNYYSDMVSFHLKMNEIDISTKTIITVDKNETIYNCLLMFTNNKISVLPIMEESNGGSGIDKIFGFFYLKDIVYFFANGEKFSFSDPISKFITDLYDGIDAEKPFGRERMIIKDNNDFNLKEAFELMGISPERKIFITAENGNEIITISDIFKIIN